MVLTTAECTYISRRRAQLSPRPFPFLFPPPVSRFKVKSLELRIML